MTFKTYKTARVKNERNAFLKAFELAHEPGIQQVLNIHLKWLLTWR